MHQYSAEALFNSGGTPLKTTKTRPQLPVDNTHSNAAHVSVTNVGNSDHRNQDESVPSSPAQGNPPNLPDNPPEANQKSREDPVVTQIRHFLKNSKELNKKNKNYDWQIVETSAERNINIKGELVK